MEFFLLFGRQFSGRFSVIQLITSSSNAVPHRENNVCWLFSQASQKLNYSSWHPTEGTMKKMLFIFLASATSLAFTLPAHAQYVPYPVNPGYAGAPVSPQYDPRASRSPSAGYQWREQRAQDDWRNNSWRERVQQEDWRTNNWRVERRNEDWRQREDYAKTQTKNNAIDRGYVECGVGSVGSSMPCDNYKTDKTEYNARPNAPDTGYAECDANSVIESCRSRPSRDTNPVIPPSAKRTTTPPQKQ
jgi:hypothetical protein